MNHRRDDETGAPHRRHVLKGFRVAVLVSKQNVKLGWLEQRGQDSPEKCWPDGDFRPDRLARVRQRKLFPEPMGARGNVLDPEPIRNVRISIQYKKLSSATGEAI